MKIPVKDVDVGDLIFYPDFDQIFICVSKDNDKIKIHDKMHRELAIDFYLMSLCPHSGLAPLPVKELNCFKAENIIHIKKQCKS